MPVFRTVLVLAIAALLAPTASAQPDEATQITVTKLGSFQPQTLHIHLDYAGIQGNDGLVAATVIAGTPEGKLEIDRLMFTATDGERTHQITIHHDEILGLVGQGRLPPLESTEAFGLMSTRRTGLHIGIPLGLEGVFSGSANVERWRVEIEGIHLENEGWEVFLELKVD